MSNESCFSVHSEPGTSKKNMLERVLSSAAHLFLSKSSGAKAKYKHGQQNTPAKSLSAARTPSSLDSHQYTQSSTPSPPCSPPTSPDAKDSLYATDPIFTALDANNLPDLTFSISVETEPLLAPQRLSATTEDVPKHSDSSGNENRFTRRSRKTENPFKIPGVKPITPPKDMPGCKSSGKECATSSPPPTPPWSITSSILSYRQSTSSLVLSSAKCLSTPSSPSSPNHSDLQPRKAQYGLLKKSQAHPMNTNDDSPCQKTIQETEEQQKVEDRLRKATDFENRIRAIEREEGLKQRGSRRGLGTKRRGSLTVSLFSTSPSTCSRTPSKNLCPGPPLASSSSPKSPALPHSSPATHVSPDHNFQLPTPVFSNRTISSKDPPRLLPGFLTLGVRRGLTCRERDERDISQNKAKIRNKSEKKEVAVNPSSQCPNVVASQPPTRGISRSSHKTEPRKTPESQGSNTKSSLSWRHRVSPHTISTCGRSSPSTKKTRRPSIPIFPTSHMTPPPTPPSSVQQTSPRCQKKRRSGSLNVSVNSIIYTSNAYPPSNVSSADRSDSPRSRTSYYKKIESNGTLKLTLTPNLVRGTDGEVGRVWRGHQGNETNYDSDERGNASGDEDDGQSWGAGRKVLMPSHWEFGLTRRNVESGLR